MMAGIFTKSPVWTPIGAQVPILQMRRYGTAVLGPADAIERARVEFERHRCVRLPQLLEPELWRFLQRELATAQFTEQTYERIGSELCMIPGIVDFLMHLMSNDAGFLEVIRGITACDAICGFAGRVYRLMPGQGHEATWHNDLDGPRLVGMSVNLSPELYCGGTLQLRDSTSRRMLREVANTGPGDAILFRIAPDLQHRVTPVNGAVPKSAYAGWFQSERTTHSLGERQ